MTKVTLLGPLALAALLVGCQPKIGDSCSQSTDCSIRGDRTCDTSQPGGYCTVQSCRTGCPDNAACVAFGTAVPGCAYDDWHAPARSTRSLCLRACTAPAPDPDAGDAGTAPPRGDCRFGYVCVDPRTAPWRGRPLDDGPIRKVCVPADLYGASSVAPNADTEPPVCKATTPDVPPITVDASTSDAGDVDAADASGD